MNLMKILLLVSVLFAACKKDRQNSGDKPGGSMEPVPEWASFTTANSLLPDDQINALVIDRNDVKWLATSKGLVRMSGSNFTVFTPANSSIPDPYITAVAVEGNGTVWAGTAAGLVRYTGNSWSVFTAANSLLPDNAITCIAYDSRNKVTWVGTGEGLARIDGNGQWQQVYTTGVILSMAADQQGALWVGAFNDFAFRGMIKKYYNGQWTTYQLHDMGYASAFPYGLAVDKANAPVVALAGTVVKSVLRLNGPGWEELPRPENASGFKAVLIDGDNIWVGGRTLCRYGSKESPLVKLPGTDSPVAAMARDSKGRIWIGTMYGGLFAYYPATR
ncbi:MAG: hypothetical protein INR73_07070 [Williamsia sp.]|nr:hypothetical protein [Williamsia sp.]